MSPRILQELEDVTGRRPDPPRNGDRLAFVAFHFASLLLFVVACRSLSPDHRPPERPSDGTTVRPSEPRRADLRLMRRLDSVEIIGAQLYPELTHPHCPRRPYRKTSGARRTPA